MENRTTQEVKKDRQYKVKDENKPGGTIDTWRHHHKSLRIIMNWIVKECVDVIKILLIDFRKSKSESMTIIRTIGP